MIDSIMLGIGSLVVLIGLIAIRMPIAYAMILVGGIGVMLVNGVAPVFNQLKTLAYGQFSIYDLSVIPLFILMGALASKSGMSASLFRAANAWLGWMRGGTAMAAIAACAGFGAVCGSSLATASTMGKVALPELQRYRYSGALATGTLAAGGVLGILIPPSVVLIIYAIIVEANVVSMFAAALIPGLLAVVFFITVIAIYVAVFPDSGPRSEAVDVAEFRAASLGVLPVLTVFAIVLGGIYGGFYNPTPAASVGVALVMVFGLLHRTINWFDIKQALFETAGTAGMIYLILLGAELMKIYMSRIGLP
ncbi:MAG: TRAP transporter large permease subunit, partial [Gammaproteobacteria bacterium]